MRIQEVFKRFSTHPVNLPGYIPVTIRPEFASPAFDRTVYMHRIAYGMLLSLKDRRFDMWTNCEKCGERNAGWWNEISDRYLCGECREGMEND